MTCTGPGRYAELTRHATPSPESRTRRGAGRGLEELTGGGGARGRRVSFWGNEKSLEGDIGDGSPCEWMK